MTLYTDFRVLNVLMAFWSAACYVYIDRYAPAQFWHGDRDTLGKLLMPKGEFISRVGRVIFLLATANSTLSAIVEHKSGGQQVLGLFLGLAGVSIGCAWMVAGKWRERHPKSPPKMKEPQS